MAAHRITVARLRNVYLVPRQHPAPGAVRERLDCAARDAVPAALGRSLSRAVPPDDERVWLIRRLDLGLALDPGADGTVLAGVWGARLATAVAGVLAAGADDENVVVFPSREAFVARYLADRVAQRAGWWYAEFESLAALPVGAAVRTALARDPGRVGRVLRELARAHALEPVLERLTVQDARSVWGLVAACEASVAADVGGLIAALPRAGLRASTDGYATAHNAIRLFVAMPPGSGAASDLCAIVDAALLAIDLPRSTGGAHAVPADRLVSLRTLLSADPAILSRIVAGVAPHSLAAPTEPRVIPSAFAGLFLLWRDFPAGLSASEHSAFRYLVALKLLGRARAAEAWHDPAPLLAAGLDHPPGPRAWRDCAASVGERFAATDLPTDEEFTYFSLAGLILPPGLDPETDRLGTLVARVTLRAFAAGLRGFGAASADYLYYNFLAAPGVIRTGGDCVEVRLRPPPLHVVLRLAGRGDDTFTLPDGRLARVTLEPD